MGRLEYWLIVGSGGGGCNNTLYLRKYNLTGENNCLADVETMKRSPLEMHVEILEILDHCGPLKLTPIMYIVNVDCSILKQTLVFLAKQGRLKRKSLNEKEKSLR